MSEFEVTVELQHVFGSLCGSPLREAALFADSTGQQIAFPVGRQLAVRHAENNETSFLTTSEKIELITACCVSRDRAFLALAEKCTSEARISVYDLRSGNSAPMKCLKPLGTAAGRLLSLAFSAPVEGAMPRYLLASTSGAESALVLMNWEGEKTLCKCKLPGQVDRVSFPSQPESLQATASGPNMLRLMQIRQAKNEVSLRMMPAFSKLPEEKIVDHTWLEGNRLVVIQEAQVHIISAEELQVVRTIEAPFGDADLDEVMPLCIRAFTGGFLLGGSLGYVAVWETDDAEGESMRSVEEEYHLSTAAKVRPEADGVCTLDITVGEEQLLLGFGNADMGLVTMASLYNAEEPISCHVMGNHSAAITAMDMAVHRTLIITACKGDSSLRVWNYTARTCEICMKFDDAPCAVAIHPFGYYAAVGFGDRLRLYHILVKDLKLHSEIVMRSIHLVKFSFGGHLLAVCQGKVIHLFSVRTLTKATTFQGHSRDVTSISFDPEDRSLWSTGDDGKLIIWNLNTFEIEATRTEPASKWFAICSIAQDQATCSLHRNGKQLLQRFSQYDVEFETELHCPQVTTLSHFSGSNAFLAGTQKGSLQVYMSLHSGSQPKSYELPLHSLACNALCISVDGRSLVTAGEDGVLFILSVQGLASHDELAVLPLALHVTDMDKFSPEAQSILASKEEILKLEHRCEALMGECRGMKERLEREASLHEEQCAAKVAQAQEKDQAEIKELQRRYAALEEACAAKERESQGLMKAMETRHNEATDQLSKLYQRKLSHESDRLLDLQIQKEKLQEQMLKEKEQCEEQLKQSAIAAKEEEKRLLVERDLEIKKHQDLLAFVQHRFEVVREKRGEDHDQDVMRLKHAGWEALEQQKKVEEDLRREQETLLRGLEMQEKDREAVEEKQQEAASTLKGLREQAEELKRTLQSLQGERDDRAATLAEKERRIETYKSKERTLKRFKLLLDKKLGEVVESVQPKDSLIQKLNQDLSDLEAEFERQLTEQRALEEKIDQRRQHAGILTQESKSLKDQLAELDSHIYRFRSDVHTLVTQKDLKEWPKEIRRLYHTHVDEEVRVHQRLPMEEMMRQMRVVERRVAGLAAKSDQIKAMGKMDVQRKAHENATLVHELNELRVLKCSLVREVKALTTKLKEIEGKKEEPNRSLFDKGEIEEEPKVSSPPPPDKPSKVKEPTGLPGPRQSSSRELLPDVPSASRPQLAPLDG